MNSRDSFLNEFRGPSLGQNTSQSSEEEVFQNATLRPILKLQNDLIVLVFQNYVNQIKLPFKDFTVEKKMDKLISGILKR